jgi:hypothetical protein
MSVGSVFTAPIDRPSALCALRWDVAQGISERSWFIRGLTLKRHPISCLIRAADRVRCVHLGESGDPLSPVTSNKDALAAEVKEERGSSS